MKLARVMRGYGLNPNEQAQMLKTFEENDGEKCEIRANGVVFAPILAIGLLWLAFAERSFGQQEILEWRTNNVPESSVPKDSLPLVDVAYGNGRYVIVGKSGLTLVSEDAANWRTNVVGTGHFSAIEFGNGIFIAQQREPPVFAGKLLLSSDGLEWNSSQSNPLESGFHFFHGQFIAFDGRNIVTSTDGVTWEKKEATFLGSASSISDDGSRVYFWSGDYEAWWSDGDFARAMPFDSGRGMQGGAFGHGTLLIRNRTSLYRFDGKTNPVILTANVVQGEGFPGMAFGDGNFVVSSTRGALISRDGKNWRTNSIGVMGKMRFVNHRFFCLNRSFSQYPAFPVMAVSNELAPPPPNTPPDVDQPPDFTVIAGATVTFGVSAHDPDFDGLLSYRVGSETPEERKLIGRPASFDGKRPRDQARARIKFQFTWWTPGNRRV
jgi:hypothetical protein